MNDRLSPLGRLTSNIGRPYPGEAYVRFGGERRKAMADQLTTASKERLIRRRNARSGRPRCCRARHSRAAWTPGVAGKRFGGPADRLTPSFEIGTPPHLTARIRQG